ncbi:TPA: receptor-recognizing protein [Escherichia coli]
MIHTLGADHNFNGQWFRDRCFEAGGAPIVFNITGDLVSYSRDVPLFFMYGDTPNEYVQLNIHGVTMYGRGGNGWAAGAVGASDGGVCIQNDIGGRLRINNGGAIAGGGGGGGRPFGLGGNNGARWPGGNASLTAPGAGGNTGQYWAGGGGEVGQPGQYANPGHGYSTPPTNPGAAVAGSSPTWQNRGAIYGPAV